MKTRAQALNEWFHGLCGQEPAGPDVGEAFTAGWNAALDHPVMRWAYEQLLADRHMVALMPPNQVREGPRYAGYYCIDAPEPQFYSTLKSKQKGVSAD